MDIGEVIKDQRYTGKDIFDIVGSKVITPNIDWDAPKYHPFAIDELILVHLTDQEVTDGILRPQSYAPLKIIDFKTGEDKEWFYPRETLHFTLNGCVDEHSGGVMQEHKYSWKDKKFAYLIPLKDVAQQVISLFTHDTVVLGKVILPKRAVVIEKQTPEKIKKEIKQKKYPYFHIKGVHELDPAFMDRTNVNINHPYNFRETLCRNNIDGPYSSASINNIHVLDGYFRNVFSMAAHDNCFIIPPEEIIKEIKGRINYFRQRHEFNPFLVQPIARLERGAETYIKFVRERQIFHENRDSQFPKMNNSEFSDYNSWHEKVNTERREINEQLLWKNINSTYFSKV